MLRDNFQLMFYKEEYLFILCSYIVSITASLTVYSSEFVFYQMDILQVIIVNLCQRFEISSK